MKNDEVLCASISAYGFDLVFFIYLIFLHQELQHVKKIKFRVIFFLNNTVTEWHFLDQSNILFCNKQIHLMLI